ncbi:MAG: 1,4-dihydroxy-2-naphthoate polyprenyltransferase [Raineya sp.]
MLKNWLQAFRLRTLPLALTSIGMGGFLAVFHEKFNVSIFLLSIITTIFLQILSNLANDYGDSVSGVDAERIGEQRTVQTGAISKKQMLRAIWIFVILALFSGLTLLYVAFFKNEQGNAWAYFLGFLGLGLLAIVAAITYTVGKKPYGYIGLGDLSVFLFFGWVGVIGSFFLHTRTFQWDLLLPASACGLFAVAVLNLNNIRDIETDRKAGKNSIPVRLGRQKAVYYHYVILFLALLSALLYAFGHFEHWYQFLFLLIVPLLLRNAWAVSKLQGMQLDGYLKQMALTALAFVLSFGLGLWLK